MLERYVLLYGGQTEEARTSFELFDTNIEAFITGDANFDALDIIDFMPISLADGMFLYRYI